MKNVFDKHNNTIVLSCGIGYFQQHRYEHFGSYSSTPTYISWLSAVIDTAVIVLLLRQMTLNIHIYFFLFILTNC